MTSRRLSALACGFSERAVDFQVRLLAAKRSLAGMQGLIPHAGPGWETALLLPVPAAEPAASCHRARLNEAPGTESLRISRCCIRSFSPAGISEPLLVSLGGLFAGFAAFEFTLDRIGWFGDEVVWFGPRDPAPITALTSAAFTAFRPARLMAGSTPG